MSQPTVRYRGPWHLTVMLSLVVFLAAVLFGLCGWLVVPPG
jgi:hypothetical protein